MPFGTKPQRTLLQRVNDQRRSLALAGLAGGAVVAALFRRKRSGGEAEFGEPVAATAPPEPVAPSSQPESGPPPADVAPASASATDDAPAVDAAPAPAEAASPTRSSSIADPATGELSAEEASILAVLAQSGRADDDRTAIAVATSLERDTAEVTSVLRKLGAEGVVSGELYTAAGDKIWAVTERGVRRLGAQH